MLAVEASGACALVFELWYYQQCSRVYSHSTHSVREQHRDKTSPIRPFTHALFILEMASRLNSGRALSREHACAHTLVVPSVALPLCHCVSKFHQAKAGSYFSKRSTRTSPEETLLKDAVQIFGKMSVFICQKNVACKNTRVVSSRIRGSDTRWGGGRGLRWALQ